MESYLVQRGSFKDNVNFDAITGIDSIIDWDYMGSSEFEWGALPKSLKRIVALYRKKEFIHTLLIIRNKSFYLYSKNLSSEDLSYIVSFFENKIDNPYGGTKEMVNIHCYFEGKYVDRIKKGCIKKTEKVPNYGYCDFWWDIDNDWMLIPATYKDEYKKMLDKALSKLLEKDFDIKKKE